MNLITSYVDLYIIHMIDIDSRKQKEYANTSNGGWPTLNENES